MPGEPMTAAPKLAFMRSDGHELAAEYERIQQTYIAFEEFLGALHSFTGALRDMQGGVDEDTWCWRMKKAGTVQSERRKRR